RRWGGIGLGVLSDKAEDVGSLVNQQLSASFAYTLGLAGPLRLALGSQLAYSQQRLGFGTITTGSQWVPNTGYVPGASTGEEWQSRSLSSWNLGSGLSLYGEKEPGLISWQLGLSAYALNQPGNSLAAEGYRQPVSYRAQAAVLAFHDRRFSLVPDVSAQLEGGRQLWSLGSLLKYKFQNDNPFDPVASGSINLLTRAIVANTLVMGIQLEQPHYVVGFSYDWGFGKERTNQPAIGVAEFAISLRKSIGRKKQQAKPAELGEVRQLFEEESNLKQTDSPAAAARERSSDLPGSDLPEGEALPSEQVSRPYEGEGVSFALRHDFSFAFNDASLNEDSRQWLDELYELLQNNPHLNLQVIGHTDDVGTRKANQQLSEQRAIAVYDYLLQKGLAAERMNYEGRGAKEPLVPNSSEAQRAQNRRVAFVLYTKGQ
ncbi:MAG: OmpA family protein, partial [Bacteroidetes bacterium]|nr:OmpA family protein [Bacteroidota bacterium]